MAVTGWKYAGTIVDDSSVGSYTWTNPGNAGADDNSYAEIDALPPGATSHRLKATNFGFTTGDVPSGKVIDGIEVECGRFRTSGATVVTTTYYQLYKGGSLTGSAKTTSGDWPTAEAGDLKGGSADLWSGSFSDSDIRNSGFGVGVYYFCTTGPPAPFPGVYHRVDWTRIRVYYSDPPASSRKRHHNT